MKMTTFKFVLIFVFGSILFSQIVLAQDSYDQATEEVTDDEEGNFVDDYEDSSGYYGNYDDNEEYDEEYMELYGEYGEEDDRDGYEDEELEEGTLDHHNDIDDHNNQGTNIDMQNGKHIPPPYEAEYIEKQEYNKEVDIDGNPINNNNNYNYITESLNKHYEEQEGISFYSKYNTFSILHPAILALLIGGIILIILLIVLCTMFVVYRMRKKDEGSYALDENLKKKSKNIIYTKAPNSHDEFFA